MIKPPPAGSWFADAPACPICGKRRYGFEARREDGMNAARVLCLMCGEVFGRWEYASTELEASIKALVKWREAGGLK